MTDFLSSYWSLILYSAFFPFIACVLILLTPGSLKKYTVKFIDLIFFMKIGSYPLIKIVMFIEGLTWLSLIRSTYIHYQEYNKIKHNSLHGHDPHQPQPHHPHDPPMVEMNTKLKLWREQRNCYIAAWGFTSWWYVLYYFFIFCFFVILAFFVLFIIIYYNLL